MWMPMREAIPPLFRRCLSICSTVAELERRRILRLQASALLILAIAAVLTLLYVAKVILVVVLISVLIAFVLAPLVDLLTRFEIPNALASLIAVLLLVIAGAQPPISLIAAPWISCRSCRNTRPGSSR